MNNVKVSASRKSTVSVMSNPHFGGVTLMKGKVSMFVPKEWLFSDGRIKKFALEKWNKLLKEHNIKKVV